MNGTRALAVLVAVAGSALASWAIADGYDTDRPTTIVVGDPQGYAPRDRVDVLRRGQSASPLPTTPTELWRRELAGGLDVSPVIDSQGALVAALVSPDIVKLDADGRQAWRTRLGAAPAVAPPAITSDGSTVAICSDGTLWSVSAGGAVRFTVDLRMRTKKSTAAPLARDDGSVVVAGDRGVVVVSSDGAISTRASLASRPVGGVIPWQNGFVITSLDGTVHVWQPPAAPRKVGELGGAVEGGTMLAGDRTLIGVVDRKKVVGLNLRGGDATLLAGAGGTGAPLEGPPTLDTAGVLLVTNVLGELFGIDARGAMVRRLALEPMPTFGADAGVVAGLFSRVEARASPPLVVDGKGVIAFARNSGKVGIIDASGSIVTANPRLCSRPLSVLPAGQGRLLVTCHSGSVAMYVSK